MSKMKEVAALLGVEIGEEFRVTGIDDDCRITDSRFEIISLFSGEWVEASVSILYELLKGKREIIKKPWKPKNGEQYWYATTYCGTSPNEWHGGVIALAYYAVGNCFKTEEEAKEKRKEVLARLEKVYADGTPLTGKVVFEEDIAEKKEDGLRSVIRCRQCKYYHEAHYEDPGEAPYIKHQCKNKYGMPKYTVRPDEDYCSRAEKKECEE